MWRQENSQNCRRNRSGSCKYLKAKQANFSLSLILQINKYPWAVALVSGPNGPYGPGAQFCGGTLVASKYVVTAAHCMFYDFAAQEPLPLSEVNNKNIQMHTQYIAVCGSSSFKLSSQSSLFCILSSFRASSSSVCL